MTDAPTDSHPELGFHDLNDEISRDELPVHGTLPPWLTGSLLRTGPAKWEVGRDRLRHWFDGLAMLHRFTFADGRVSYANKFLRSRSYEDSEAAGRIEFTAFATDPCRSIFQRIQTLFTEGPPSDNANVNIGQLGERFVALTETPLPVVFDQHTLDTAGVAQQAPGQLSSAHPHYDRTSGSMLNYATHLGRRSSYRLYQADADSSRVLGTVDAREPAYMHSFGITERWFVLTEFPLVVNPLALALNGKPFIENYRWKPERGTRITLVDRRTGEVGKRFRAPAMFAFHHVNAHDEGDDVVVDLCAFPDSGIIRDLYLDRARTLSRGQAGGIARSHLTRIRLAEDGVRTERLSDLPFDLPRINETQRERANRYVWGAGTGQGWVDHLVKVDTEGGEARTWQESHCFPGEPVFVARPDAAAEDDGVLLSVVLDSARATSFLLVLDAATLEEIARAEVDQHIPYGIHGQFTRAR